MVVSGCCCCGSGLVGALDRGMTVNEDDLITVRRGDLERFVTRSGWSPGMLATLSADEYRKTIESDINLRRALLPPPSPDEEEG